jgi:hypothetical protein
MRYEEAAWIGGELGKLDVAALSPMIELGSSTAHFRTLEQPHIDRFIIAPLRSRGVDVIHADQKAGAGIDISGNIYEPSIQEALQAIRANSILCCNIFEHVTDRAEFAHICDSLLQPGGLLVVSVPYSYPHHSDPIDTYFRPDPDGIAALFPGYDLISGSVIESQTYASELSAKGAKGLSELGTQLGLLLAVWVGPKRWAQRNHRLLWLFRRYKIAVAILRKGTPS